MPSRQDFLVEIGTEELPPKALKALSAAFAEGVRDGLVEAGLEHGEIKPFATPRRLALLVETLALRQPDRDIERMGPPVRAAFDADGEPTKAATGFAENCGVGVDALERIETPKGERLVFRSREPGQKTETLLPDIVNRSLSRLPIPKRMRWGAGGVEFVRPVHWVVMLFGRSVIPAEILGITAGQVTYGHRFHAPGAIKVKRPADYPKLLERAKVIAAFDRRREQVAKQVEQIATNNGGTAVWDDALLDEVTALVEWPVTLAGRFDHAFLGLPEEIPIATLQDHQRCFAVRDSNGALSPWFVTVSNIESRNPDVVRKGNERVVRPQLADAKFFYDSDRTKRLADRLEDLAGVVFEARLGTLYDKTERVLAAARNIAKELGADTEAAARAATLAKCDLLTEVVGEFPELQGTMGRYYAAHDGESDEVAAAIEEQYRPRFAGDALPDTTTGRILAVVDKLDTLTGIFALGRKPTGTRDPFGLRRAALGVLRIVIESPLDVDLEELIRFAAEQQPVKIDTDELTRDVFDYMMERLRAYYADRADISADVFDAVLARRPTRPIDFHERLLAVRGFMSLDASVSLAAANKRIANILKQADGTATRADSSKLVEPAEKDLYAQLIKLRKEVEPMLAERRYENALTRLAGLREPVDRFFDDVLVMTDDADVRDNRLALLTELRELFLRTADLSRLQIG